MEFNLKTKDNKVVQNVAKPKPQSDARQKLWSTKSSIVFKREDFLAFDKLGQVKQDQIQQLTTTQTEVQTFTEHSVESLKLHQHLDYKISKEMGFTKLTPIQHLSFLPISQNKDVFIKSQTGSGKTLAFLIPIMNQILKQTLTRQQLRLLIISPTRELSTQTEQTAHKICNSTQLVCSSFTGGMSRDAEKTVLRKGANVIVCTPGRLQDHITSSENFAKLAKEIQYLVLDECDYLLQNNFQALWAKLQPLLPKCQKVFVSATISEQLQKFSTTYLKNPVFVSAENTQNYTLPPNLEQKYTVIGPKMRLSLLISLLAQNASKRQLVFVESKSVCNYLNEIFLRVQSQFKILHENIIVLHGGVENRPQLFQSFLQKGGILLVTDVAARGLNLGDELSGVDLVIQYEMPNSIEQYVHRAGRAGRMGQPGQNILIMQPNEVAFLDLLVKETGQSLQYTPADSIGQKVLGVDNPIRLFEKIQAFIEEQTLLIKELAIQAYQTYTAGYKIKDKQIQSCFDLNSLHLGHVAKSFGLNDPPSKLAMQSVRGKQLINKKRDDEKQSEKTKSEIRKQQKEKDNRHFK